MDISACLDKFKRVHFIGVGGVSMSALAAMLALRGYTVTGSDDNPGGRHSKELGKLGIPVMPGRSAEHLDGAEMVVYTAAVKDGHPELEEALHRRIPVFKRSELLSAITSRYECPVGVAGTHGKTTTTAMVTAILLRAGLDPTVMVGGSVGLLGGNYRLGKSGFLVFESDEYMDSFLQFHPKISVILNIEADHPDYFADESAVVDSFRKYTLNTLPDGVLIYNGEDENCRKAVDGYRGRVMDFGLAGKSAIRAEKICCKNGYYRFDAVLPDVTVAGIALRVPGLHNVKNALAAGAAASLCGAGPEHIRESLSSFAGVERRFQLVGRCGGATVVDDYAHHPSEVAATLKAARELGYRRVICVFQPHTYTRTKGLLKDFAKALALADMVVLADIYAAREDDVYGVSSADLSAEIPGALYHPGDLESLALALKRNIGDGDLVITMGAGDIDSVARLLCDEKAEASCG